MRRAQAGGLVVTDGTDQEGDLLPTSPQILGLTLVGAGGVC